MVEKTVLDNGLTILTKKLSGTKAVSIGIWLNSGSRDEPPSLEGITHFLEHMFFKGTTKRSAHDIAIELDVLGGISNAYTTKESLCFYAKVLNKNVPKLMDIFLDILLDSTMDGEELEKERFVILQEIKMVEDSPEDYVHTLACEKFWKGHPLGHPICGYRETISRIGRDNLIEYKGRILNPKRMVIAASGDIEHDDLVSIVEPVLGSLKNRQNNTLKRVPPHNEVFREPVIKDLEQAHFCVVMPGVSLRQIERFPAYLTNTVFGNSMSSRLFQEVREKRGLAYAIYSFLNCYEDTGMFGVYAAVDPGNIDETFRVILDELKKVSDLGISEQELQLAKECSIGSMYLSLDSTDAHMSRIARNEIIYGRELPPEEIERCILGVTPEDVKDWIGSVCTRDNLSVLMVGSSVDRYFDRVMDILDKSF